MPACGVHSPSGLLIVNLRKGLQSEQFRIVSAESVPFRPVPSHGTSRSRFVVLILRNLAV